MVKVNSIVIERLEGLPEECQSVFVTSFDAADKVLKEWALTAPKDGCYDKCDFNIVFNDGESYSGRYDLVYNDSKKSNLLQTHMKNFLNFYAGNCKPDHMTWLEYRRVVERDLETKENAIHTLENYDLA